MHINMIPWSTYPPNLLLWCGCGRWKWKQKEAQMDAIWCHMMLWMPRMDARFPEEMQHCYCGSCRKLSGAAWQSWMPIQERLVIYGWQLDKDAKISSLYFKGNAMKIGCAKKVHASDYIMLNSRFQEGELKWTKKDRESQGVQPLGFTYNILRTGEA